MKKEKQIGIRVGLPAFFALEVEEVYRYTSGVHRALAFPDFLKTLAPVDIPARRTVFFRPCRKLKAALLGKVPEEL
jgi:hypothetical protein